MEELPTCSTNSFTSLQYERLPHFLIQQIGDSLSIDDRLNFMASSPYVFKALKSSFRRFTYIQICDEYRESFVKIERTGEEYFFSGHHLVQLLQVCSNLEQILIAVKPPHGMLSENSMTNCPIFDSTLYHPGGYIGSFCRIAPSSLLQSLKLISLNIDLSVSSFSQLTIPCPVEDLYFSISHLHNCTFNTFIQIGFCASNYSPDDGPVNRAYLNTMHQTCEKMRSMGCKAIIDIGANDGYVDLSVEVGQIEYSFAYFYYNPKICEAQDQDDLDEDENFIEFNELVMEETHQQPQFYGIPIEFLTMEQKMAVPEYITCEMKYNDLYKSY